MASSRCVTRYSWTVGVINGLMAVLLLNAALGSMSSGLSWLVPWKLGVPWGLLTAWRASVYVRQLLRGQPDGLRGVAEGFAFMAGAMLWNAAPGVWTAIATGHDVSWLWIVFYCVAAGIVGAAIAAVLLAIDLALVEFFSPVSRIGGAS